MQQGFYKQNTLPGILTEGVEEPSLPQQIGPYKIESLLAKGGMSLLYLGLHPTTRLPLVVKTLSPEFVTHPEATERFLKEAHIITMADHPNIVKLYGEGKWEGGLYIAMEMIHGISLRQFISQQSLSLKRTIDIILQVAYALLHLHTHGVIHRDLKPENILISEEGTVKVIDFGIAQLHEEPVGKKKPLSQMLGTPSYMSPEQKEDPHKVTFATDIYSLGIITYELILGKLSYGMVDLSFLPKGVRKIVGKAIAVSAKERYQDIVDLISDLSQYIKSGEVDREKSGSDQAKELMETLLSTTQSLSVYPPPDWPMCEIGISRFKGAGQESLYYDFFKLPDNTYLILMAATPLFGIPAPVSLASARGVVKTLLAQRKGTSFSLLLFMQALNEQLYGDSWKNPIFLNLLHLNPMQDELHFASCGLGGLSHIPSGSTVTRVLEAENTQMGTAPAPEFSIANDNWLEGDTLVLHTFDPTLEENLATATSEHLFLSTNRQAEGILRTLSSSPFFAQQSKPKALIALRRLT